MNDNCCHASVCHISSVHSRYDVRIFVKQCATLSKSGYRVNFIVADGLDDEVKDGVNIYSVAKPQTRISRIFNTPRKIYRKVLQLHPLIVHFHDPELIFIGVKLSKLGYRVIYDVHEDVPKQILHKHYLPYLIRPLLSRIATYLERKTARSVYGIVAATEIIAIRFGQYNPNTIAVHNYPLVAELGYNYRSWYKRQNNICYIGSISLNRGLQPLVESLSLSKLQLKLAGMFSGDTTLDTLRRLDGGKYIDYLGVLDRRQVIELLSKVKIGVVTLLPTPSYLESLPIKMFEYMLAGIPVVASNFPLWREIIHKYECGILVDPNNVKQISQACKWLIAHQEEAKQMGDNGRNMVLKYFNWEQEQVKILKFYATIKKVIDYGDN